MKSMYLSTQFLLMIALSHTRFVKNGKMLGELNFKSSREIPRKCQMNNFKRQFEKENTVSLDQLESIHKCSKYFPQCTSYPGELKATFMENKDGIFFILAELQVPKSKSDHDCWGYLVDIYDGKERKQTFIKLKGDDFMYHKKVYVRLGFVYHFVVTMLPSERSLVMITKAPTPCQLEVIDDIYYKVQEVKACKNEDDHPTYEERYKVAEQLCSQYPNNMTRRKVIDNHLSVNPACKLYLLSNEKISF